MADKFMNIAKNGWHPERDRAAAGGGQSESRLGSRVGGMLGRGGKDSHSSQALSHQSAPLSSLKDPSTFAPPPKRLDYSRDPTSSAPARTNTAGTSAATARRQAEEEASQAPAGPYRVNTTGLDTSHLPKPPAFRPGAASTPTTNTASKPKPNLPPRLPPRQNSNPNEFAPTPPPSYGEATQQKGPAEGVLNQGALNRLGQAGVSVPGLGIGRNASPPVPPRQNSAVPDTPISPPASAGHGGQLGELQSRFAKMSTAQSGNAAPAAGTTWADKQAALRTASNLRDDPSKVSAADVRGAASTANNFQQRHGAQVASGWKAASGLNNKYGITGKVNSLASPTTTTTPGQPTPPQSPVAGSIAGKKPAPPPPPKRRDLGGNAGEPPPIPTASKPKF